MIVVAILLGIAAVLLGAVAWAWGKRHGVWEKRAESIRHANANLTNQYARGEKVPDEPAGGFWWWIGSVVAAATAVVFFLFSLALPVDTGQAVVLKSWTGEINPEPVVEAGIHWKSPFESGISWDVKNKITMFSGPDGTTTHNGQQVNGAEVEFTDKDGIKGWLDIQVSTSIKPQDTVRLTSEYGSQEIFQLNIVENDIKSLPRDVISGYSTVRMFEDRSQLRKDIVKLFEDSWESEGIIVDKVNLHGIRYPDDVQQRFKDAQNAKTDLLKAETQAAIDLEKANGEAAAAIAKAQGEKTANDLLAASLTPQVLQKLWIDGIAKSGTIIVPQDFTSLGNLAPSGAQ